MKISPHGTVKLLTYLLIGTLATTGWAASTDFSTAERTRIWRDEFPLPDVGLAPPTFDMAKAASRVGWQRRSDRPHPAVARIIVPEKGATSYGSGTLIDVREKFGMVITNWHVVRDATGTIEVVFPDGFTSKARALKVDADWDLAALVIWQPPVEPVSIAATAPRPGDELTICGYGQGNFRCATGRCTQYYAPRLDFPRHMVELDVEARQGDSGGPIFNRHGELAGVLFGAGQGTTLGSFGGRVGAFLATLAPDIGRATESLAANQDSCPTAAAFPREDAFAADPAAVSAMLSPHQETEEVNQGQPTAHATEPSTERSTEPSNQWASLWPAHSVDSPAQAADNRQQASAAPGQSSQRDNLFEQLKTVLAAVGLLAIVVQVLRVAR